MAEIDFSILESTMLKEIKASHLISPVLEMINQK